METGVAPAVAAEVAPLRIVDAGVAGADDVLARLGSRAAGLTRAEAAERLARVGPNAVLTDRVSALAVLGRQLRSALLALLFVAAVVSYAVGQHTDGMVITAILAVSVGFGFVNEYRAQRAGAALHDRVQHRVVVVRDRAPSDHDVRDLVPGDVVHLDLGMVVPADVRILAVDGLECDESVLTGEAEAVVKRTDPGDGSCAFMGTVVRAGNATAVVVATGRDTQFGRIAAGLGGRRPETEFQQGLRHFSMLLARVAAALTALIFVINVVLQRPILDAILFSLAIAVGITPQLLPAIVTTSLAAGSRRLARQRVLVKRLVCVEDLGNVEVLFTDKTGTLTTGRLTLRTWWGPREERDPRALLLGLLANEAEVDASGRPVGGNPLDVAVWRAADAGAQPWRDYRRLATVPFDHERRRTSALVDGPAGRLLVTKGAPEELLDRCVDVPAGARDLLDRELRQGARVVAVATRPLKLDKIGPDDERDLAYAGLLIFDDPPKADAKAALARLAGLGVAVKVITGDHPDVAVRTCADLGLDVAGVVTGADLAGLDDAALADALPRTTVFARVSPEDKARIIRAQRHAGRDVAFLGDGVNDALALHAADVGISVDSATDVAKDAADVLLLDKDLDVLASGITEGRRIFANTIKYVLMGTSSNFGNMFSAAGASAFLPFLPMLPAQILLNNLVYDLSQVAIPTDRVDADQLARPAHWDLGEIKRFMLTFGPLSSVFDFLTFAILLQVLDAGPAEFRTGWFVESLATQILVVFIIRTHARPFWRSRPSGPLVIAALAGVAVAAVLPLTPAAGPLGFTPLPLIYLPIVAGLTVSYLALVEVTKRSIVTTTRPARPAAQHRHLRRRAARFV